jgi:uncharacterized protein
LALNALPSRLRHFAAAVFPGVDPKAATILVVAACCYLASDFEGSGGFYGRHFAELLHRWRFADMGANLYWLGTSNLFFGLIPLLTLVILREPLSEYGVGLGDRRFGLRVSTAFLAVMLPLTTLVSFLPAFRGRYPLEGAATHDLAHFVVYEIFYLSYFVGWEFFHRGFLLFGMARRIGALAIFVQALPFTLTHFGKPEPEAWGSLLAGIALGALALRARSFWYGAGIHVSVALYMDVLQSFPRLRHH